MAGALRGGKRRWLPLWGGDNRVVRGDNHLPLSANPTLPSQVEQRLEPAKRAAHNVHKRLQACLQGQTGADMDKRVVSEGPKRRGLGRRLLSSGVARLGLGPPCQCEPSTTRSLWPPTPEAPWRPHSLLEPSSLCTLSQGTPELLRQSQAELAL